MTPFEKQMIVYVVYYILSVDVFKYANYGKYGHRE